MGKRKVIITTLMVALCFLAGLTMIACGGGGGGSSGSSATDVTAPTVSSTVPVNAATNVGITSNLAVTFSEAMLASTITNTTFTVTGTGAAVAGVITYTGVTATFDPTASFAYSTVYTATITTGAKDAASNAMTATYVWAFTTGAAPDITPPTVASVTPLSGSATAAINTSIQITFSEAMLASTISSTTITLTNGGVVTANVSYAGVAATLTPISNMAYSTLYTVTVVGGTNGVKDLASNAMTPTYTYTFTTAAAPTPADAVAPMVCFTTPISGSTMAVNSSIVATFSEPMSAGSLSTATFTLTKPNGLSVPGTVIYNGVTARFTPSNNLFVGTVYTATITTGAKDLALNSLATYTWVFTGAASDVSIPTVAAITPASGATVVPTNAVISVLFSEPVKAETLTNEVFNVRLTTATATTMVAGAVTYNGRIATFIPTSALSAITYTYTVTISATLVTDLAGNPLATTTWNFTTSSNTDNVLPTIASVSPVSGAAASAVTTTVDVTFSEEMAPLSINPITVKLTKAGVQVAGTVTLNTTAKIATITPFVSLAQQSAYTVTVNGATDQQGNALSPTPYSYIFTTADNTAPTVASVSPVGGAINVSQTPSIVVTFSEAMQATTLVLGNFSLTCGGQSVGGTLTVVVGTTTATITVGNALPVNSEIVATVTTGVKDDSTNHNALAANYVWKFSTLDNVAAAAPAFVFPESGSTAGVNTKIVVFFSEPMLATTITSSTFYVGTAGTGTVVVAANGLSATLTPTGNLVAGSRTVYLTTGITDASSNAIAAYSWLFTASNTTDDVAPLVSYVTPVSGTGVALNTALLVNFTEVMNPSTINTTNFTLASAAGAVAGTVTYYGTTARFTPTANLTALTVYTATITTGVTDLAGNGNPLGLGRGGVGYDFQWNFTTHATLLDTTPPTIVQTSIPINGATPPVASKLPVLFDEAVIASTINSSNFYVGLSGSPNTPIAGTVKTDGLIATFTPTAALAATTAYVATVTSVAKDAAGIAVATNITVPFTTGAADVTPPTVSVAASGSSPNEIYTATFTDASGAMDASTINTANFTVRTTTGNLPIAGVVSYNGALSAVFTPLVPINTTLTPLTAVFTSGGMKDLSGNALVGAATPTFSPAAGAITFPTNVTIASASATAIYYTTDGSTPTTGSTLYSAPVAISSVLTLKALAVRTGYTNSAIGSAAYTQTPSANLTGLVLTPSSGTTTGYTFAAGTYTYTGVTVVNAATNITVTPTLAGATITVEGVTVTSGVASGTIALTAGTAKVITITVTETGKATITYTISVTRATS